MKDRNVEYPNRYRDQDGRYWRLEQAPGEVIEEGSIYSKADVLPDSTCEALGLPPVSAEPKDAFLRAATGYRTAAVYGKNMAYLLSQLEIMGKVQDHSHIFYDIFYSGHTDKIGYIDNRKISVTGTLASGSVLIPAQALNVSAYPVTDRYANGGWQEFTIEDAGGSEVIYAKEAPVFVSTGTETWPTVMTITDTGTYRVTLMGAKGQEMKGSLTTVDCGGKGGTLIFEANFTAGDVLTLETVDGAGKGMRLLLNGEVIAAAGGGGRAGGQLLTSDMIRNPWTGGDGGGSQGGSGRNQSSGSGGAVLAQGGAGNSSYPDTAGLNAPDGRGGKEYINYSGGAKEYGERIGGGGYAGGGGSFSRYNDAVWTLASGGGGSSYLADGYTLIENSRGTNAGNEYALIAKKNMILKNPLANSYVDPVLYRSKLAVNTTAHKAAVSEGRQQLRMLVRDISSFYDFAVWLQSTGIECSEARASYGVNGEIDESEHTFCRVAEHVAETKEIHIDGSGIMLGGGRYLAVSLDINAGANAELLALYGALA